MLHRPSVDENETKVLQNRSGFCDFSLLRWHLYGQWGNVGRRTRTLFVSTGKKSGKNFLAEDIRSVSEPWRDRFAIMRMMKKFSKFE